jgi:hypothetical protein
MEERQKYTETLASDYQESSWIRRYRYQHLRSNSSVPMSVRNNDRHGLSNLAHEGTKATDRIKVPPAVMYIFALLIIIIINFRKYTNDELNLEKL